TIEAVPSEFTLADLERIIALCRSQDTPSDKVMAPAKYTPEAVLALASRMGLDHNVVCRVMQDYAEGKYEKADSKISPEEFRAFMEEMRGYMKKKPRKNGGEGSSDERIESLCTQIIDIQNHYVRNQKSKESGFTHSLGKAVWVVGLLSAFGLGFSYMITSAKEDDISTRVLRATEITERQVLKDTAELYGDVFFLGESSEVREANAINDYYTALNGKYSLREGVGLLKYLDKYTAYGLGTAELCEEATRYVTALNERSISLEKGMKILDAGMKREQGAFGSPMAWAVIDKAIVQLPPPIPTPEEEAKKKLLNDLSNPPNPDHNPTDVSPVPFDPSATPTSDKVLKKNPPPYG
ncbi:MAG: hypothetical protein AABY26_03390, partial [Nanoarchaeota archaeon]